MYVKRLVLQHFRSYQQQTFTFDPHTTLVVGPNTAGKTNLVESLFMLSFGKSFRAEKDVQMIAFGEEIGRIQGLITNTDDTEKTKLEVMLAQGEMTGGRFTKKFLVNDVPKRRIDFEGLLPLVLFSPEELDIVIAGPSLRRRFLDEVLEQVDREYRVARVQYDKAIRQRNALLSFAKETGKRSKEQFAYWDELLITNGQRITQKREEFLSFVNQQDKDIFSFTAVYDKSVVSEARLLQYTDAEIGAGVTLVGPHRDDFFMEMDSEKNIRSFGSRGQQRLVVLQLKLLQINFIAQSLGFRPLLVLDDIFSELDAKNTGLVLAMIHQQQTIITTANKELVPEKIVAGMNMIELKK
ncbi:MAG TPA: DNA replication and repair protein RecF [Candidatus Saccharimonadales bacterium]|nr:DNA replication and repair protein RecF [Candidatus Saccharimonadales bacterium]